jgi:type IV fimbrial biogenesis protein FimT
MPNMRHSLSTPKNLINRGFTLIELMVAVSILAVLVMLAIPDLQAFIASTRLTSATNDVLTTFSQARSNAIQSGTRFTVCRSANSTSCASSGGWEQGWIMFRDPTRSSATPTVDTGELVGMSTPALPNGIVMKDKLGEGYVSFSADGLPKQMLGGFLANTYRICSTSPALSNDKRARDLVLSSTGRIEVKKLTNIAATCPAPT